MGQTDVRHWNLLPPSEAPSFQDDHDWRHFDKSVNAISFGFVATAILISMFLVMAIFERFLMTSPPLPPSSGARSSAGDVESQMGAFNSKHPHSSPKGSGNATEVSVLMPGEDIPTFIAQPAPVMCQPERIRWLADQRISYPKLIPNSHSQAS
ncbi:hypothetical protein L6452_31079 [Arctium lappa]|uniref:Uncharacterized protein n=1 Tax=Arctium lappa TaxID=4217 RepID=A0ACB8ZIY0_ARCLA|nr:hypothetical protein L6452_31079 [Arctium lappa]